MLMLGELLKRTDKLGHLISKAFAIAAPPEVLKSLPDCCSDRLRVASKSILSRFRQGLDVDLMRRARALSLAQIRSGGGAIPVPGMGQQPVNQLKQLVSSGRIHSSCSHA